MSLFSFNQSFANQANLEKSCQEVVNFLRESFPKGSTRLHNKQAFVLNYMAAKGHPASMLYLCGAGTHRISCNDYSYAAIFNDQGALKVCDAGASENLMSAKDWSAWSVRKKGGNYYSQVVPAGTPLHEVFNFDYDDVVTGLKNPIYNDVQGTVPADVSALKTSGWYAYKSYDEMRDETAYYSNTEALKQKVFSVYLSIWKQLNQMNILSFPAEKFEHREKLEEQIKKLESELNAAPYPSYYE